MAANLPPGPFACIAADPPWHFKVRTESGKGRSPEGHYDIMSLHDIKALPVGDVAAKDAHLFLWTTGPVLPQSFAVMEAWGFRYSAVAFTWVKFKRSHNALQLRFVPLVEGDLHVGLGFTTRKNAEFCLLGRRGSAHRNAKNIREIILAPVRQHSRKPDEAYERIERYCDGPRLDMFARESRPGWTAWGNETEKFDLTPPPMPS